MPPRNNGLPRPPAYVLAKQDLLDSLKAIDSDRQATERVLGMETQFRQRIQQHIDALPLGDAPLSKFNTNPFVLLFHTLKKGYSSVRELEDDILPAKSFMSMETSAGRMVESVVLPVYGWETVPSKMHSAYSVVDGKMLSDGVLKMTTLKSGPRCLNDEMSKDIAVDILNNCETWCADAEVSQLDFTYGVLYGTRKQSNKKDWHILRNIDERVETDDMITPPAQRWNCAFRRGDLTVNVNIRIGVDLWTYIAAEYDHPFVEIFTALIRACVEPATETAAQHDFTIADLGEIVSWDGIPADYNVSVLQRSQIDWLFFVARHFCDELRSLR